MSLLRIFLITYAGICIIGSLVLFRQAKGLAFLLGAGYLLINAVIIIGGILLERKRYHAKSQSQTGWQRTNERFIDTSSGKLMEVYYNSETGERSYREVRAKKRKKNAGTLNQ